MHDSDFDGGDEEAHGPPIPAVLTPALEEALGTASTWSFDAFRLYESSNGQPLAAISFWLLQTQGIIQNFGAL